jgi:hypothetical protein
MTGKCAGKSTFCRILLLILMVRASISVKNTRHRAVNDEIRGAAAFAAHRIWVKRRYARLTDALLARVKTQMFDTLLLSLESIFWWIASGFLL